MSAAYFLAFLIGCLLTYIVYTTKIYEKDSGNANSDGTLMSPPRVQSIDNYTSAQPPPPFTTDQSPNTVYRSGCLTGRNALGVDCANANCPSDCNTCPNSYLSPRYIYNVVPTSHGYHLAGHHDEGYHRGRYHRGRYYDRDGHHDKK